MLILRHVLATALHKGQARHGHAVQSIKYANLDF
jgi:hypothetical protein